MSTATTLDEAGLPCYPQPAHLRTTPPKPTRRFDLERYGEDISNVHYSTIASTSPTDSGTTTPRNASSEETVTLVNFLKSAATDAEMCYTKLVPSTNNTSHSHCHITENPAGTNKKPTKKRSRACGDVLDFRFRGLCSTNSNNKAGTVSRRAAIGSGEGAIARCVLM
ncbi:hypothetical protein MMC14_009975 [Varicellaria rhodocarpa]|nr:hypothetical protein [Varicellaria rhodocarpa]